MADINIEKKRTSIWPWLIGLLLIAALAFAAWHFYFRDRVATDEGRYDPSPPAQQAPGTEPAPAPGPTP